MPDWISHILLALIICELFRIKEKSLVILGSLLPDLLFKLHIIGNIVNLPKDEIRWFFAPLHTPLGCFLITFLVIFLFKYSKKRTFLLITIGWVFHLLADMTTKSLLIGQNMILFPFSWKSYGFGLFWPEQYYVSLLVLSFIYLFIKIVRLSYIKQRILKQKLFK